MAKFNMGEKASKEEAIDSLTELIGSIYNGVYHVRNTSDDGGQIIELVVEVEDPSKQLEPHLKDLLYVGSKWKGWRTLILKVPPGYIDAIILAVKRDDY
jgi:hypothetical protein